MLEPHRWHRHRPLPSVAAELSGGDGVRAQMWDTWLSSVGVGGGWILNLPPTVTGSIPSGWAAPAIAFGKALKASFGAPVASLLATNVTLECGTSAAALVLPVSPSAGRWNAVRSAEDVYHHGQLVSAYTVEALVGGKWLNTTSRGQSVGVGTVDMSGASLAGATKLRWRCLAAAASTVVLSAVDLYHAVPPLA